MFTPDISKFRAFRLLYLPKSYEIFKVLAKNEFYFTKRALRVGDAHSKWLIQVHAAIQSDQVSLLEGL